jgi:MFS family permease
MRKGETMNRTLLKVVILSISIFVLGATALSPALANISTVFKDASAQTIMLLVTLPSITLVFGSLVFSKLSDYLSRRGLFSLGVVLFLIGGLTPYFMNDLTMILVMRAILGLGIGLLFPLSTVLITDFFEGSERGTVMGLQSIFINIGGIVFPLLGGLLCATGWQNTFLAYLVGIVLFLFVYTYLPEPAKVIQVLEQGGLAEKAPIPWKVYFVEFVYFIYSILYFAFFINIAIQVVGENLGNAASAGFAVTVYTIGGLLTGLIFGKIARILKGMTIPVGWVVTGIGMAIISGVYDFNLILVGCFVGGIGFTIVCPAVFNELSIISPPSRVAFTIAIACVLNGMGQFVVPFVFDAISGPFAQGPGRFPILVSAIALVVGGVLLILQQKTRQPNATDLKIEI